MVRPIELEERSPAQQFYDRHGYYERQDKDPRHDSTYLAWAADMTNRRRHCWEGKDPENGDRPTRWLDNRSPEYVHDYDAPTNQPCTNDHSDDPKIVGEIEWMRFIHEWGRIAPEGQRYFTEDGQLWITPTGLPMSDGRIRYAEVYFNRRPTDEKLIPGFSFRPKLALFLANAQSEARIECYDPELADLCQQVWLNVQASYGVKPWVAAAS